MTRRRACQGRSSSSIRPNAMAQFQLTILTGRTLASEWRTTRFYLNALATVVIGGILSSTLLTLLVLPGLYRMAYRPHADVPVQTLQESRS